MTFKDGNMEEIKSDTYSFFLLVGDIDHLEPHMVWGCATSIQRNVAKQIVINNNFKLYWHFMDNVRKDSLQNTSLFIISILCVSHRKLFPH